MQSAPPTLYLTYPEIAIMPNYLLEVLELHLLIDRNMLNNNASTYVDAMESLRSPIYYRPLSLSQFYSSDLLQQIEVH